MTALSTQINTHYVVLSDGRQVPISQKQKDALMKILSDKDFPQNRVVEVGNFSGKLNLITEIMPIPPKPLGQGYYCDFGIHHSMHESCNCPKRFYCNPRVFWEKLLELHPEINYNKQITPEIRKKILIELGFNTYNN